VVDVVRCEAAALPIDACGGRATRRVEQDAMIISIGNIQVTQTVHSHRLRLVETVCADPAIVGCVRSETAELPIDARGGGTAQREIQHPAVIPVGNVQSATAVQCKPMWTVETVRADPAIVGCVRSETAELPIDARGGSAAGREEQHPVIAEIGHIHVAGAVYDDPMRLVEAVRRESAVVDVVRCEAAALAIDGVSGTTGEKHGRMYRAGCRHDKNSGAHQQRRQQHKD